MKIANIILVMMLCATCFGYLQADFDFNRKVDLYDFAVFSDQWLLTEDGNEPTSVGVGTSDYLIAASGSPTRIKARADYVCDGVADQVEIQSAIDALPIIGGQIHLSQGRFYIDDTIHLRPYVTLTGTGTGGDGGTKGTTLYLVDGANCNVLDYVKTSTNSESFIRLANFTIEGNKTKQTQGHGIVFASQQYGEMISDILFDRVYVRGCKEDGFHIIGNTIRYEITDIDLAKKTFRISGANVEHIADNDGDITVNIPTGSIIKVINSPSDDSMYTNYTVVSSIFHVDHTDIVVGEDIDIKWSGLLELADYNKRRALRVMIRNCCSRSNDGRGFFLDTERSFVTACISRSNQDCEVELRDCSSTLVTQCYINTTGTFHHSHGIYLNEASGGVSVTNSFIACVSNIGDKSCGIYVRSAHHAIIKGNTVRDYRGDREIGIYVYESERCLVADNIVIDCDVGLRISKWSNTLPNMTPAFGNHLARNDIAAEGFLIGDNYLADGPIAKTVDFSIGTGYSSCTYTNTGANTPVTFSLPAASETVLEYTFVVGEDGQELRIIPEEGDTIALADGVQQAPGKYIKASNVGATCRIKCVTKNQWEHFDSAGVWTAESP